MPCQSICFHDCRQILTSFFHLFIGLLSILCVLVTDGRFSLFSIHPSSMAVFCCPNICMDTICLAHRWLSQFQRVWTHFVCNHIIFFLSRKRNLSTNYLPVGAFHLRGGFNTIEGSETFPSTSGSLSAVCRSLYRLSGRYVGFWY